MGCQGPSEERACIAGGAVRVRLGMFYLLPNRNVMYEGLGADSLVCTGKRITAAISNLSISDTQ
jgi:hypothetical protein